MFSGIVRAVAPIISSSGGVDSLTLRVATPAGWTVTVGDSIATSGVCLTVSTIGPGWHEYCLVPETLSRTIFGRAVPGRVNLEQSLRMGDSMDGHVVTGHVDCVGRVETRFREGDSWRMQVSFPGEFSRLVAQKGSIAIDGVSLTIADVSAASLTVVIIPHTSAHTTLGECVEGGLVNMEFDIMAKHLAKMSEKL